MKKLFFAVLALFGLVTALKAGDAIVRSGDSFEMRIGGVPGSEISAINGTYTIDGDGYLNLPYLGKLPASNMTASQIQSTAEHAYVNGGIFTHPTITVTIAATARFVSVGGQVKAPQRVAYTPDMTVLSAINAAGDFNEYANQSKVRLLRDGRARIIDCKVIRKDPSQDVKVSPGDQIQVPQSIF